MATKTQAGISRIVKGRSFEEFPKIKVAKENIAIQKVAYKA